MSAHLSFPCWGSSSPGPRVFETPADQRAHAFLLRCGFAGGINEAKKAAYSLVNVTKVGDGGSLSLFDARLSLRGPVFSAFKSPRTCPDIFPALIYPFFLTLAPGDTSLLQSSISCVIVKCFVLVAHYVLILASHENSKRNHASSIGLTRAVRRSARRAASRAAK